MICEQCKKGKLIETKPIYMIRVLKCPLCSHLKFIDDYKAEME